MKFLTPKQMVWAGFVLLLAGAVLPLLMVVQIIESSFALSFISYASSVVGLVLGTIGAIMLGVSKKRKSGF